MGGKELQFTLQPNVGCGGGLEGGSLTASSTAFLSVKPLGVSRRWFSEESPKVCPESL